MDRSKNSEITCPHCWSILSKPVTMPCGHHVCSACLNQLAEFRGRFNCPVCFEHVSVPKCIANPLLENVILELSNLRMSEQTSGRTGPIPFPTSYPPLVHRQEGQGIQLQYPGPPAPRGKSLPQSSDRLVLTHNQRQYIRYVVVTDPDTGIKYTVGIKHVLNTTGSTQLVQVLERNIGSEYKKGSSKRVCKSVLHSVACAVGTECPFIHVTPEGWEARRKFSSANQKRNKDVLDLDDGPPLLPPGPGGPPPGAPHDPAEMPFAGVWGSPHMNPWMAPLPYAASAPFSGSSVFGAHAFPLLPGPPHSADPRLPPFHVGEPLGSSRSSTPPESNPDAPRRSDAPLLPSTFPFPIPMFADFHLGPPGFERGDLPGHRDARFGPSLGRLSTLSAASSMSASSTGPGAASSSSHEARNPHESSAASTSSSIGAISSVSSSRSHGSHGSPLASRSPLIESIATAELPELLPAEKATDNVEESRMSRYFTEANNLWKPFPP